MATLILPFLNKKVTVFKGPALYLSDSVLVDKLQEEDAGLIHQTISVDEITIVPQLAKCVYINDFDDLNSEYLADRLAAQARFLFNAFRESNPVALPIGIIFDTSTRKKKRTLNKLWLETPRETMFLKSKEYRLKKDTTREDLINFYKIICKAFSKNKNLQHTLYRFNSALVRSSIYDKIVDLTIALESLIEGETELAYRVALCSSILAEPDESKRPDLFNMIKRLYDARSKIVHGTSLSYKKRKKVIDPVEHNWDKLLRTALNAIVYYVIFLSKKKKEQWPEHLKKIVLGVDTRII